MIAVHDKALAIACNAIDCGKYGRLLCGKKLDDIIDIANRVAGEQLLITTDCVHISKITGETTVLSRTLRTKNGAPYATEDHF